MNLDAKKIVIVETQEIKDGLDLCNAGACKGHRILGESELIYGHCKDGDGVPSAFRPTYLTNRMLTLHARLTAYSFEYDALVQVAKEDRNVGSRLLIRLEIAESAVDPMTEMLKVAGINDFFIFPDLEGLGRWRSSLQIQDHLSGASFVQGGEN